MKRYSTKTVFSHLKIILCFNRFSYLLKTLMFLKNSLIFMSFPIANMNRLSNNDLYQIANSEYFNYFRVSGAVSNRTKSYFRREWTRLAWMAMEGDFHIANIGRTSLILEARSLHGLDEDFVPMTLEKGWTTHYGHLGCLINFRNAQELGLVRMGRRLVLRSNSYSNNRPIYRALRNKFDFMDTFSKNSIFDTEPLFHFTDKVSFASTNEGFKDPSELFNLVYERRNQLQNFKRESFEFSDGEIEAINRLFQKYGYSYKHPFVVIHIRETRDKYSARDSIASSFIPSIQEIIKTGRLVIRIGLPNSSRLPSIPGLIDLRNVASVEEQFIHDFVISNCDYLVTSQSGPAAVAHAIGVPTLTVDGVAIAKSCYSTSALSMTLPKPWHNANGHKLSYEEVFELGLGFCELEIAQKIYHTQCNSATEILLAVREFSKLVGGDPETRKNPIGFQEAKRSVGGFGDGLISEIYFS